MLTSDSSWIDDLRAEVQRRQDTLEQMRPTPAGVGREGGGISQLPPAFPPTHRGEGGPTEDTWEDTMRARRRRPRHGRGET